MDDETNLNIKDFIIIAKRRRWGFIIPFVAVFSLAVATAFILPSIYRSTSTILIEDQQISRDYVMAAVTSYAEQRLQQINQRIMSSARLTDIIKRFNLYEDERKRMTIEEVVQDMRKDDIKFSTITADVSDSRTGSRSMATIAFTVSYEGKNPAVVQQVANVLASLYLEENSRVVGEQTASTSKFLEDEMKSVQAELAELESKIAAYKRGYNVSLPELYQFNIQALERTEKEIDQMNDQLRTLREKETYMLSQLSSLSPDSADQGNKDRLRELRAKLGSLRAQYSDVHPDVIKTKSEIAALEQRLSVKTGKGDVTKEPDNPAYQTLSAQLAANQADIASVKRQIENLTHKREDYRRRLQSSPTVEEGYKNLMVVRNNTQLKYDDLMKKFMESRVAGGLEKGHMGERFSLIDPASVPEKPVRPNRPAIILIGFLLGIGAGVGTAAAQEFSDHSARRSEDLTKIFPFPVLAEIPLIISGQDEQRKTGHLKAIIVTAILAVVIMILVVHFFIIDMDVLWARLGRRFDNTMIFLKGILK
ncbi:MAG: GumC family protein [Syntrophales bacterium]